MKRKRNVAREKFLRQNQSTPDEFHSSRNVFRKKLPQNF
jgi:hypothetical protein